LQVITAEEARAAFQGAGYAHYRSDDWQSWRQAMTSWGGKHDADRLRALRRAGLTEEVDMLEAEINAPDGMT
jgi:hypothetical protein